MIAAAASEPRRPAPDPGGRRGPGRGLSALRAPPGHRARPGRSRRQRHGRRVRRGRGQSRPGWRASSSACFGTHPRWPGSSRSRPAVVDGARRARASRSSKAATTARPRRSCRPTWRCATTAWPSCSTRPTAATAIRSSTAPTAGPGSPSRSACRTTAPTRPWPVFACVPTAPGSTRIPADRRFHAQPVACAPADPASGSSRAVNAGTVHGCR